MLRMFTRSMTRMETARSFAGIRSFLTTWNTSPLRYILRDNSAVRTEDKVSLVAHVTANPVQNIQGVQGTDYGESGILVGDLIARLPHDGPIFKNDNATVFQKVEETARGASCESTIKEFLRKKDGRGAYLP